MSTPTEVAGRYRLEGRLGAGGMSTVFKALDTVLERPVAVKLLAEHLADDEAFVARFRREALAAARLQHPNIVQVFDSGRDPDSDRHYIVMEYVEGPSCADLLRDQEHLEIDDAVDIVRDACRGLNYAHRAGVIHRDVKPGNLLVSSESGTVKLADFGIAKAAEQSRITQVGSVLGTAAYLSPEQARGEEAEEPSDIYSLGVCAYQFLTGRLPHEYGSLTELALKQQNEGVAPVSTFRRDVPPALDRAVLVALERDPTARYATALEMAEAIEAGRDGQLTDATSRMTDDRTQALAVGDTAATRALRTRAPAARRAAPTGVAPPRRAAPARAPRRRNRGPALIVALILLVGAIATYAILSGGAGQEPATPVTEETVGEQVDGLRDLIRQNTR